MVFALYPPYTGGAATYSSILINRYQNESRISSITLITEKNAKIKKRVDGKMIIKDVLMRKHSLSSTAFIYRLLAYVAVNIRLVYSFLRFKLSGGNTVHLHGSYKYLIPLLICRLLRLRLIVDIRDLYVSTKYLKLANVIGYASENIKVKLLEAGLKKKLTHFPVLFDRPKIIMSNNDVKDLIPYIFYAGEISQNKGIDKLINCYLSSNVNDYILVLAGKYKLKENIPHDGMIKYLGELPHSKILEYISSAELVINPSKNEGLSRLCVEAILLNKPTIFSSISPELNQLASYIVEDVASIDFQKLLSIKERYIVDLKEGDLKRLFDVSPILESYFY